MEQKEAMEIFTSAQIFLIKESLLKINCKEDLGGITNHLISILGEKSKDEISACKIFSAKPIFSPFHLVYLYSKILIFKEVSKMAIPDCFYSY